MTVRFFPVFLKKIYFLPPTIVNGLFAVVFICTGVIGRLTPRVALYIGKIETIFFVQLVGIISLFVIASIPPLYILIPFFLIRGPFMNSSQPLQRSILMDRVPKIHRGKFNALQTLSFGFLWSLSAGVGGILSDHYGYSILFYTTATIYIFGTFPYLILRKYVKERVTNS